MSFALPKGFLGENQFVVCKFHILQTQRPNIAFHRAGNRMGFVIEGERCFFIGFVRQQLRGRRELYAADFGDILRLACDGSSDVRIFQHQAAVFRTC